MPNNENQNKKPSSVPEGLSSLTDDEAITEINLTDFLEENSKASPLFEGFHEDIEKTEKSLESELQSLYDDIMGSGPQTIVPQPMSVLTSSESEPKKVVLADPEIPEDGENSSLEDLWMDPEEYFDDDIPVVSLDEDAQNGYDTESEITEDAIFTPEAPAEEEQNDDAKSDIFSMIDMLKAETDKETGFSDILTEIESNNGIAPVETELSAAVQLVSSQPEEPEIVIEEPAQEKSEEADEAFTDWDESDFLDETPASGLNITENLPEPEISAEQPAETEEKAENAPETEVPAEENAVDSDILNDPELAFLFGMETEDKEEKPENSQGFVISIPEDANDYESAALAEPEKLYEPEPMSTVNYIKEEDFVPPEETPEEKEKKKSGGAAEVIRKIILSLSIITIVVSIGILANTYLIEPLRHKSEADALLQEMNANMSQHAADAVVDDSMQNENPDVSYPEGMLAKYASLYAANDDMAGWVSIPGFEINLPIAQGVDNEYYLKKNIYGKYTSYGVPFFDYRMSNLKTLHRNTVVYGHNMRSDDYIFGMLENYRKISGFEQAPVIECNTIYGDHTWFVYAVFITNAKESDDNGYVFPYNFIDISYTKFESYIKEIDKRKFYTTGVDISPTDKILTLSTCCYDFEDARLVVVARERRPGESINVDTSKAYKNDNPKYPQAWYDANNKSNPYSEDSRW